MSLTITQAGILDTLQDTGRLGSRHLGVNPGGAMDKMALKTANVLVGNNLNEAGIELHFPAAAFLFTEAAIIAISGADFFPTINGFAIPLLRPIAVHKNAVLKFAHRRNGGRAYLSLHGGFAIQEWMGSKSTHIKLQQGGLKGRALQKNDTIAFHKKIQFLEDVPAIKELPWKVRPYDNSDDPVIHVIQGPEWHWLTNEAQQQLLQGDFAIDIRSDRMGYQLAADPLQKNTQEELVSSGVEFGTLQLLPNGQLIILMADHQTTGGYPRIAQVISTHHSRLAQMMPGQKMRFQLVTHKEAEDKLIAQQRYLQQVKFAALYQLETWMTAYCKK